MKEQRDQLREQLPHGNAMFSLMVHEIETECSFNERVCHWHDELEFLVVTKGQVEVHVDNRIYLAETGSIIYIPSNHLHSISGKAGCPGNFFAIVFHQNFMNSFLPDIIQLRYLDSVKCGQTVFAEYIYPIQEWERKLHSLLWDIRDIFEKKETAYEMLIKAKLYEIWYLLYVNTGQKRISTPQHANCQITVTKSIIEYITENYDRHISLDELSKKFNISEGHLCRSFKLITQRSVIEYINYCRINRSIELLRETDRDVSEIAGMVGFNTISYFNKMFKKYMHMTPSEFRQAI